MTFKHAYSRFQQFGGWRLVRQYARMGVLGTAVKAGVEALRKGKPLKDTYPRIRKEVDRKLLEQYGSLIDLLASAAKENAGEAARHERSKTVWTSWWQGEDRAPRLVRACWESQRRFLPEGWRHVVVTCDNYKDYITLPEDIVEKARRGVIPQALFSDLVRLELLIRHGGIWMDASVLCTAPNYPQRLLTCPLFLFQYRNTQRRFRGFSNWFIVAERGNHVLKAVQTLLYQYWRDYDCTVEYYIFHLFINELAHRQPELLKQMPFGNAWSALRLGEKLAESYNEAWWREQTAHCCFHKLNYRKENDIRHSYCEHIMIHVSPQ